MGTRDYLGIVAAAETLSLLPFNLERAALLSPPSITNRTMASRPLGVRGAFLWVSVRFSANRWCSSFISAFKP